METVIGLFKRYEGADRAVEALEFAGFPEGSSMVSRDKVVRERVERVEQSNWANDVTGAAAVGAVAGMVVGGFAGFFICVTVTLIWGSGPDLAAWALSTALGAAAVGVGIGMATGSVLGALIGLGFPKQVHVYAERMRRGGILVTMRVPDSYAADIADNIMRDSGAVDINHWTNELRAVSEWTSFREDVGPEGYVPLTWMHTHSHS
jgi:hypothetical protein